MPDTSRLIIRIEVAALDEPAQKILLREVRALLADVPGDPRPTLEHQSTASGPVAAAAADEEPEK